YSQRYTVFGVIHLILDKFEVANLPVMNPKKSGFFDALPHTSPANSTDDSERRNQFTDLQTQQQVADLVSRCVPPRLMYRDGAGGFGTFTATRDLSDLTKAKLFSAVGNNCRVFVRFSDAGLSARRGFSVKFYTEEGIWDLVGQSSPVFYLKEPES